MQNYRAFLKLSPQYSYSPQTHNIQYTLFHEIEHFISVHEDGSVTESHYISYLMDFKGEKHEFNPPRPWDPNVLDKFKLIEIN